MSAQRLVVIEGVRTPFCRIGTDLAALGAEELGRIVVNALLARTGIDPGIVDEVIFGCVGQPPDGTNVARVIGLRGGIPPQVPAVTVHRNCASGCEAITQAYEKLRADRGEVFIVGGTESMSHLPQDHNNHAAKNGDRSVTARNGGRRTKVLLPFRFSKPQPPPNGLQLGFFDPVSGLNLGQTAELIGREAGITREMQDLFAVDSHRKALAAHDRLAEEITPVYHPTSTRITENDNGPRSDSSIEGLAQLRPVFERETGTVTTGNTSLTGDGAVALLVMSESRAAKEGLRPLGVLTGYAYAACDPARMGLGPVHAIAAAEKTTGLTLDHADLVEIHEAFAAQVLAAMVQMKSTGYAREKLGRTRAVGEIDHAKLNVNGGALALGHPVGASGARLALTALKELGRRNARRAVVALSVGGGQGAALWVERA